MVSAKCVSAKKALEIILASADTRDESSTDDDENEFVPKEDASEEADNYSTKDRDDVGSTADISSAESDVETVHSQTS